MVHLHYLVRVSIQRKRRLGSWHMSVCESSMQEEMLDQWQTSTCNCNLSLNKLYPPPTMGRYTILYYNYNVPDAFCLILAISSLSYFTSAISVKILSLSASFIVMKETPKCRISWAYCSFKYGWLTLIRKCTWWTFISIINMIINIVYTYT